MEKIEPVYTSCPFCKTGRKENEKVCRVCGLKYDELKEASNKQAKKRSLKRKLFESLEDEIVLTNIPPKDVDIPTFKTLTFLFGFFGLHNLYVGKFFKAFATILLSLVGLSFELVYYITKIQTYLSIGTVLIGLTFVIWIVDIVMLSRKKFKFPIKLITNIDVDKFYETNKTKKSGKK